MQVYKFSSVGLSTVETFYDAAYDRTGLTEQWFFMQEPTSKDSLGFVPCKHSISARVYINNRRSLWRCMEGLRNQHFLWYRSEETDLVSNQ